MYMAKRTSSGLALKLNEWPDTKWRIVTSSAPQSISFNITLSTLPGSKAYYYKLQCTLLLLTVIKCIATESITVIVVLCVSIKWAVNENI